MLLASSEFCNLIIKCDRK